MLTPCTFDGSTFEPVSSFVIRHSSFAIRHSSFVIRHSSFVILHSSFVIRHSSFVIRHASFVILHSSFVIEFFHCFESCQGISNLFYSGSSRKDEPCSGGKNCSRCAARRFHWRGPSGPWSRPEWAGDSLWPRAERKARSPGRAVNLIERARPSGRATA